jgi:hypothetical protein
MKVVHLNKDFSIETNASKLEKEGELEKAASVYEKLLTQKPYQENAYNRLMIIYRKLKDPAAELRVIKKGIHTFETLYKRSTEYNNKVVRLSKALQKATGLTDKKGKQVYEPEPLGRWKKRMKLVEKKLKE